MIKDALQSSLKSVLEKDLKKPLYIALLKSEWCYKDTCCLWGLKVKCKSLLSRIVNQSL